MVPVRRFDPLSFKVPDSILSVFAIILSILVLVSQTRQRRPGTIHEKVEFEINIRVEEKFLKCSKCCTSLFYDRILTFFYTVFFK
ncbi:DUF1003 domain-containing protein [Mucilaginibacter lutimaris]|uniref:DUF1003 domain-containing protein n=1 Tax=Mucilaginibacter lutimaris TaxID=931629 RepID=A0ABW2ZGG1_9SPHI